MGTRVHPTAVISPGAELGTDVEIGPYTVIGSRVQIGDRTRIGPNTVIDGVTRIGAENQIIGQSSLGTPPQDISYRGEPTLLEIGDRNQIREFVTMNVGTVKGGARTRLGSGCLLMAYSHVAHDCDLDDDIILSNSVMLAGHVRIERGATLSGGCGAHHFVTIGAYSYIGGLTRIEHDVPPYMIVEGQRGRARKVNVVGLQRAGFSGEEIESLRVAFRKLYRSSRPQAQVIDELKHDPTTAPIVRGLIESLERTERGRRGRYLEAQREEMARLGAARIAAGATTE
jgi:UDP-N-acetylglucosamine acyltransferase